MLLTEAMPIHVFVAYTFRTLKFTKLISGWRVEPDKIQELVCKQFREMGIYFALPGQQPILLKAMEKYLLHSIDIKNLLLSAEQAELNRKQSRHAG